MIKILLSTNETQGLRKSDFSIVPDGEIVVFTAECDGEEIDGSCGCRRCVDSIVSGMGITTFQVAPFNGTRQDFINAIAEAFSRRNLSLDAESHAAEIIRRARYFPVGAILEKRGSRLRRRK